MYKRTDKTLLHTEVITQSDTAHSHTSIPYDNLDCGSTGLQEEIGMAIHDATPCTLWDLEFSLGPAGQTESSVQVQGLLDTFTLLPPEEITVECGDTCLVTWCVAHQQHFQVNIKEL